MLNKTYGGVQFLREIQGGIIMTGRELFFKKAEEIGFDPNEAEPLYDAVFKAYNPEKYLHPVLNLSVEDALKVGFLLQQFGTGLQKKGTYQFEEGKYEYSVLLLLDRK